MAKPACLIYNLIFFWLNKLCWWIFLAFGAVNFTMVSLGWINMNQPLLMLKPLFFMVSMFKPRRLNHCWCLKFTMVFLLHQQGFFFSARKCPCCWLDFNSSSSCTRSFSCCASSWLRSNSWSRSSYEGRCWLGCSWMCGPALSKCRIQI